MLHQHRIAKLLTQHVVKKAILKYPPMAVRHVGVGLTVSNLHSSLVRNGMINDFLLTIMFEMHLGSRHQVSIGHQYCSRSFVT